MGRRSHTPLGTPPPGRGTPGGRLSAQRTWINELADLQDVPLIVADGWDAQILGVADVDGVLRVVYDADAIVAALAQDMTVEEAEEFFSFNIEGARGEGFPLYVRRPPETP